MYNVITTSLPLDHVLNQRLDDLGDGVAHLARLDATTEVSRAQALATNALSIKYNANGLFDRRGLLLKPERIAQQESGR